MPHVNSSNMVYKIIFISFFALFSVVVFNYIKDGALKKKKKFILHNLCDTKRFAITFWYLTAQNQKTNTFNNVISIIYISDLTWLLIWYDLWLLTWCDLCAIYVTVCGCLSSPPHTLKVTGSVLASDWVKLAGLDVTEEVAQKSQVTSVVNSLGPPPPLPTHTHTPHC